MPQGTTTTPSPFVPPTRAELKVKYGIVNDDFEITTSPLPPLTTQPPGCWIEKQEYASSSVQLLWLSKGVLLLITLAPVSLVETFGHLHDPVIVLSDGDHELPPSILKTMQKPTYVATTPAPVSPSRILSIQEWDGLPIGSTLRLIPLDG